VLGPLEVAANGTLIPLGGAKQRALLALLLLNANEVVSIDRLIDELWGESPPGSATNMLQGYVSRLRKALDGNGAAPTILFRSPGYVLQAAPEQIDSCRFERLVQQAEARASSGDWSAASSGLRAALELWRGAALSDFAYEKFAQAEIARLDELRLKAIEDRIDAELALGRHAALVPELEALVADRPLREKLRGQLMLALYRSGRQSDALAVYRDARTTLNAQLGVEPTPALSELERAILRQDRSVEPPSWRPVLASPRRPRRIGVAAGGVSAVLVAAALGVIVWGRGGDHPVTVSNNSVAIVDARNDRVVGDIVTGDYPGPLAASDDSIWVGNIGDNTMQAIDVKTRRPGFAVAIQQPLDFAVTPNRLWVANGTSFASGSPSGGGTIVCRGCRYGVNRTIKIGPGDTENRPPATVASDGRSIWAGDAMSQTVYRLDQSTGSIVERVRGVEPAGLAVGFRSVWAAEPTRGNVVRIDPRSARIADRIRVPGDPTKIAVGAGGVWVTVPHPQAAVWHAQSTVWKIDPATNQTALSVAVPATARRVATGAGYVWVTSGTYHGEPGVPATAGVLSKIDPHTNRVIAKVKLAFRPDGVVVANGLVWVAVAPR
jgi:DNA-binding SARP family transcriptional activator